VSVTASPIKDSTGKIVGVSKVARDVTERKQAEEAVRQSETRYRTLFETLIEGFCVIEMIFDAGGKPVDYRFLEINPAFEKQTGLHNAQGRLMRDIAPEHEAHWFDIYGKVALTGKSVHFENEAKALNRHFDVCAYRVGGPESRKVAVLFNDITERKRIEDELRVTHEKLRQLLAHSPAVIYTLKIEGQTITPAVVSDNIERLLGFTVEESSHYDWWVNNLHPEDRERVLSIAGQGCLQKSYSIEYRIRHKDGTYRWVEDNNRVVSDASEQKMAVGVWTDITVRKKLEEQFRQAQKMEGIGQLAGGVAHDFNNILAVIQMQSDLLKSGGGLSTDQSEFADEITATVQRASALTRQLLLFSRREVFQPRDLDLSDSITATAKMLKRILGENIEMQLRLASQPMFIHADAGMMDQVLLNLAVNARDAMPNGGQLVIETSGVEFDEFAASQSAQMRIGSFVRLSVSDSGCGISPEILPKIFEPFFTTKGVGKGTGLGLATVFGIVQQHQGWVNVYSELNHGTTVRIFLPRLAKNGGPKSSKPALTAIRGGNETILLAEDDPSLRASVRTALSQLGYRILEAPTGVKALEVWKQNRDEIRLLLTDLVMPDGMTGKDLARRVLQENPKMKIIYMSGYSAEVAGRDFPLKEGVNFLTKPFQAPKLAQTIRDTLDLSVQASATIA
jgi:PAS domain S-box-containing protein